MPRPRWQTGDLAAARRWADEAVVDQIRLVAGMSALPRAPAWRSRRVSRSRLSVTSRTRSRASAGIVAYLVRSGHPRMPRRSGGGPARSPRSRSALRRSRRQPAAHGRSPLQESMTPTTRPRWRRCVMHWARKTLMRRGPRVRPYRSRKRSPTRSEAAANANDPPAVGASLTPTELDVVRLVSEGLANNDIAARLFVSPRTVQTHLTHVYTKLGLTSRVQLAQEAARHA